MSVVDWVCKKISLESASERLSAITISRQQVLPSKRDACANVTTCCSINLKLSTFVSSRPRRFRDVRDVTGQACRGNFALCFKLPLVTWIAQTGLGTRLKALYWHRVQSNLRSGSIFVSLWKLHGETKRVPDTNLLRNVCRLLFWLIDICRISQPKLLT